MQPVQHRHSHIHQDDVWLELTSLVDRFGSIGGLAHNLQVWLGREYRSETLAHHRLIVDARIRRRSAAAQPVHGTGGRCQLILGSQSSWQISPIVTGPWDTGPDAGVSTFYPYLLDLSIAQVMFLAGLTVAVLGTLVLPRNQAGAGCAQRPLSQR